MSRTTTAITAALSLFVCGFFLGNTNSGTPERYPAFHDMRVNHVQDIVDLVNPRHPQVEKLAESLCDPEAAYRFVRDRVRFAPEQATVPAYLTLRRMEGNCQSKAALLCSLYRAMGIPAECVRVVAGTLPTQEGDLMHAWLDLEHKGVCLQQDPTDLLGVFGFHDFTDGGYTRSFVGRESYCFNDQGLALVSPLNLYLDSF